MKTTKENNFDNWIALIFGALAILAIKSIFENDDSKIVSKKGRKFLLDDDKMKEINKKVNEIEKQSSETNTEVFI